jgi:hypothetical protein
LAAQQRSKAPAWRFRRAAGVRGLALAAVVSVLAGQAAEWLHQAASVHSICAEHGDVVEVGNVAALAARASHAGQPARGRQWAPSTEVTADEHCGLTAIREQRRQSAPHRVAVSLDALAPAGGPPLGQGFGPAFSLARGTRLLAAPKTSPPLV